MKLAYHSILETQKNNLDTQPAKSLRGPPLYYSSSYFSYVMV
jgi:hypothetical protein